MLRTSKSSSIQLEHALMMVGFMKSHLLSGILRSTSLTVTWMLAAKATPSWWAFIQEYYASDTDTGSANMNVGKICRPPRTEPQSPTQPSSHNSNATPSSCASNEPDIMAKSPSPLLDRYLIHRPPKKPKL
ncbi:UNVERIFIED_CONTAM: hypothetical protein Slati_4503900 [Sesamum latifolium]|uniref:Uncharacterized protein n=1 Tax=Sesamum latifolium TaxID=2727402 RepID=A0AAW2STC1_9LAMI